MEILKIIVSLIIPPLGAFLKVGLTFHFWLNLILTMMMGIPGLIHVIWLLFFRE
jgi:uncharacterized membrane protein YqaE (UPF0057 family)